MDSTNSRSVQKDKNKNFRKKKPNKRRQSKKYDRKGSFKKKSNKGKSYKKTDKRRDNKKNVPEKLKFKTSYLKRDIDDFKVAYSELYNELSSKLKKAVSYFKTFHQEDKKMIRAEKHKLIKKEFGNKYDIRFVFSNSKQKIGKKSKTTYADWCIRYGFKFADKEIPQSWIEE